MILMDHVLFRIRSTFHTTLQASPSSKLGQNQKKKKKNIENSNKRENLNRIKHKYNVGGCIILRKPGL
jgi:hypothetical protein